MLIIDPEHPDLEIVKQSLQKEIAIIWAAHRAVGLDGGFMRLFTDDSQDVWRSNKPGESFWFSEDETDSAIDWLLSLYNRGNLPNSPALLDPVIHEKSGEEYIAKGSGVFWSTSFVLGIAEMTNDQQERLKWLNLVVSRVNRGDNRNSGLKVLGFSDKIIEPHGDGVVSGCIESYSIGNIQSDAYSRYYILSGINYLCMHGLFCHAGIDKMFEDDEHAMAPDDLVRKYQIDVNKVKDAAKCWDAYDRHHILYERFGTNPDDIEKNNRYYNLCARDLDLFYRTGPMRTTVDDQFEFVVPGYIPKGAVTLLAAPGGTGKSSIAHHLCVLASMDTGLDEPDPLWLGQPVNMEFCRDGICAYFSGEDGPAIINARAALFDPESKSRRLQFHRTEFMDKEIPFGEYLTGLQKMPHVPILVVDPARKYLTGDENDAEVVSEFFEAIEEFAIRKQSAVVVVHHLQKGAKPESTAEVLDMLRGSQVFIDRPRVVMGMYREGPYTVVGLAKNNIPPNLGMVTEERVFARNPKNLQLMWLPGDEGVRKQEISEEELQKLEAEEMQRLADELKEQKSEG